MSGAYQASKAENDIPLRLMPSSARFRKAPEPIALPHDSVASGKAQRSRIGDTTVAGLTSSVQASCATLSCRACIENRHRFPRKVVEFPDMGIVMPDGCRLSARVWMPDDAADDPVPAILEHLPYRKRDGTTSRDQLTHPYFAGHGYASIRVDMRGNGDSEGLMDDEYSEQELQDACDVIAWAARQPWCNGNVGMMGISWGGFNCLQVGGQAAAGAEGRHHAVLDRRPLCRRHPLQGRLPAEREFRLGLDHAVLFVAAAGSADRRRQRWRDLWLTGWRTSPSWRRSG